MEASALHPDSQSGIYVAMTTPPFDYTGDYCLSFDYDIREAHGLHVYMRALDLVMSGKLVWGKDNPNDIYVPWRANGSAFINLKLSGSRNNAIDFVGITGHQENSTIRIANVTLGAGSCLNAICTEDGFPCMTGQSNDSQVECGSKGCEEHGIGEDTQQHGVYVCLRLLRSICLTVTDYAEH